MQKISETILITFMVSCLHAEKSRNFAEQFLRKTCHRWVDKRADRLTNGQTDDGIDHIGPFSEAGDIKSILQLYLKVKTVTSLLTFL